MSGSYVSIDTLLGFAGFVVQAVVLLIGAGIAWGKLNQLSTSFTQAMSAMSDRIQTLEVDAKKRSEDLARFATIETKLETMGHDLHRIAAALDARRATPAQSHSASPDILAGLRVLASLAGKEIPTH